MIRIIPRLDIKGPNLVKGIHLEGLRVLGKPENFAKKYYQEGADELIYIDTVASLYNRNSLHDIISKTAAEIFIPLTVAGGIRTIDNIKSVLRAGADKVALNTAAIKNPKIISQASQIFGSSTITVSIEASKQPSGEYLAFTDNGREFTGVEVFSWAKEVQKLGAGEILLTSIDRDGTGEGFDLELISKVANLVSIPVIASGGAGKQKDILEIIKKSNISGVAIASILHYSSVFEKKQANEYESEGNIEFLKSGIHFSKIQTKTIPAIKNFLFKSGIKCRK